MQELTARHLVDALCDRAHRSDDLVYYAVPASVDDEYYGDHDAVSLEIVRARLGAAGYSRSRLIRDLRRIYATAIEYWGKLPHFVDDQRALERMWRALQNHEFAELDSTDVPDLLRLAESAVVRAAIEEMGAAKAERRRMRGAKRVAPPPPAPMVPAVPAVPVAPMAPTTEDRARSMVRSAGEVVIDLCTEMDVPFQPRKIDWQTRNFLEDYIKRKGEIPSTMHRVMQRYLELPGHERARAAYDVEGTLDLHDMPNAVLWLLCELQKRCDRADKRS